MKGRPYLLALPLMVGALWLMGLAPRAEAKPAKLHDIADTVASTRILSKFALMLQNSDLVTFLSSRGPFTLFAPTDSAFSKLPPGMLDTLLRPENKERLQHIILFHVVNGKRLRASDMVPLTTLLSCEGNPLTFKKLKVGTQLVGGAKVVHGDIRCENGIINEIDTLLMPPASALPPLVAAPVDPQPTPAPASTNAAPVPPTE